MIIQASYPRAASTLLVNALYGLILQTRYVPVAWNDFYHTPPHFDFNAPLTVFKTHEMDLRSLYEVFSQDFATYFVCSKRDNSQISYPHPNILIYDYKDIIAPDFCQTLYTDIREMIPHLTLSDTECMSRVAAMNTRYEEIKHLPFSYTDPFYQLHGSHRSRSLPNPRLRGKSI